MARFTCAVEQGIHPLESTWVCNPLRSTSISGARFLPWGELNKLTSKHFTCVKTNITLINYLVESVFALKLPVSQYVPAYLTCLTKKLVDSCDASPQNFLKLRAGRDRFSRDLRNVD
jgi:hypothetical protein